MSRCFLVALLLAAASAVPAQSQISAHVEFSVSKLTNDFAITPTTNLLYGPTVGVQFPLATNHHLVVGGDVRGTFSGGSGTRLDGVALGPTIAVPFKRFSPYAEVLVGFARYNDGQNQKASASTDAQLQVVAGIDRAIGRRFDWRVFEFTYEQYYGIGGEFNPKTFSTGLVYHFTPR